MSFTSRPHLRGAAIGGVIAVAMTLLSAAPANADPVAPPVTGSPVGSFDVPRTTPLDFTFRGELEGADLNADPASIVVTATCGADSYTTRNELVFYASGKRVISYTGEIAHSHIGETCSVTAQSSRPSQKVTFGMTWYAGTPYEAVTNGWIVNHSVRGGL